MKVCETCRARFRGRATSCPLCGGNLRSVPDPLIGRSIAGRYVVQEKIGAGGMGTVYRARHEVVGRDVAVKFLSPDLAHDPAYKTRFLREARAANKINHEHIIDITDFGETDDGLVYLAMEYLDGTPLNVEISRGPLPVPRALHVALQIARALARAHEMDVIHRDIKPDNIYLLRGYDGDFVKILDFGLAQMKGELRVTATGTVFGTPEYMAPEQARGAPLTSAADIYALGCVVFEMLSGVLPFEGSTPDLILKHMRQIPKAPSYHVATVPPELDALVARMLSKQPDERPVAYELADELRDMWEPLRNSMRPSLPEVERDDEASPMPPGPGAVEDSWRRRTRLFRELVKEAHPADDSPPWLLGAIERLEGTVRDMSRLRARLDTRVTMVTEQHAEARHSLLRIGRALDELAGDDSRVSRELAANTTGLSEAEARLGQIGRPLITAWRTAPALPDDAHSPSDDELQSLRDLGTLAGIWLDAQRAIIELRGRIEKQSTLREDLRFQIAQLKGRMGSLSAVTEIDHGELRDEAIDLEKQMQLLLDDAARAAEPVLRHFMAFPHLRDLVGHE